MFFNRIYEELLNSEHSNCRRNPQRDSGTMSEEGCKSISVSVSQVALERLEAWRSANKKDSAARTRSATIEAAVNFFLDAREEASDGQGQTTATHDG